MAGLDFADFYDMEFARVASAARAFCGDADLAYESTQEAFARAYARWGRISEMEWPRAWVTTSALNICRRRLRRSGHVPTGDRIQPGPTSDRVELLTALRSLPPRQREATVLHYLVDCPVAVVADLMGLTEGSVKAHLFKARAALRKAMEVRHA